MLLDLELVRTTRTRGVVCCFCDANPGLSRRGMG